MKKVISLVLILSLLFVNVTTVFADYKPKEEFIIGNEKEDNSYNTRSNHFKYVYEYTNYEDHIIGITTEAEVEDALDAVTIELLILGGITASLIGAPLAYAVKTNAPKAVIKSLYLKFKAEGTYLALFEGGTTVGGVLWIARASKVETQKKYKYKYRVNLLTGQRSLMNKWVTYKSDNYYRNSPSGPWIDDGTTIKTLLLR